MKRKTFLKRSLRNMHIQMNKSPCTQLSTQNPAHLRVRTWWFSFFDVGSGGRGGSANFLTRKSCACKQNESGRPNNNSSILVRNVVYLFLACRLNRLDQYPSLDPLVPVLIRSWNLWRTHIRDPRPICRTLNFRRSPPKPIVPTTHPRFYIRMDTCRVVHLWTIHFQFLGITLLKYHINTRNRICVSNENKRLSGPVTVSGRTWSRGQ